MFDKTLSLITVLRPYKRTPFLLYIGFASRIPTLISSNFKKRNLTSANITVSAKNTTGLVIINLKNSQNFDFILHQ